ncbi:olfactory receptor 14C36-like [Anser cygnoides]|uniref:olfactory receptor 14C36-like n=1 Tax=Anser cygnoides TaxID=8845 RepID=UPI0034D34534
MERGIWFLRELAMLEVIDSNLDNKQLSKDPDEVKCTRPMWQTFVHSAPSSYASSLAVMTWKDQEEPTWMNRLANSGITKKVSLLPYEPVSHLRRNFLMSSNNYKRMYLPPHLHKPIAQLSGIPVVEGNLSESEHMDCGMGLKLNHILTDNSVVFSYCLFPLWSEPHAQNQQMPNNSSVSEFLLLAFADTRELQLLHFGLFLGIYLAALLGNGLILTAVACDHRLHTPMYFFLLNLALLDLGCISTTLPKAMVNALWDTRAIFCQGCAAQVFFSVFLVGAEYSLLTIMAYDRYVAICKPLHYGSLVGSRACAQMAAAAWGSGFLNAVLHTATTFSLPLCQGNAVDQFFCEIPQILKLSCSDAYLREAGALAFSVSLVFGCFVFIVVSYVQIFKAVLRMPSEQGRHKAFSMCLPHLAVVSLFISTIMFAHLKPPSISSPSLDLLVAVLYVVVPPTVNPLIYSMRNQDLKDTLKKMLLVVIFT